MPEYRDYGTTWGAVAPLVQINTTERTQVYQATHNEDGQRLPYMYRSFISFTYGGKNIEDFNLIATIENNSLNRQAYANFSDNVTTSEIYDGQLYWSTHFNENQLNLTLATDGITESELNDFQQWFKPGEEKELVLSEHPNRAIIARISSVPTLDLLPFEKNSTIKIANNSYESKTTLYKGTIKLTFVMDDPFWYSKLNVLDARIDNNAYATGTWTNANGTQEDILISKDALKIIQEDNVPIAAMLTYASDASMLFGYDHSLSIDLSGAGAVVGYAQVGSAIVGYGLITNSNGIATVGDSTQPGYFYYGGDAPCAPILIFSMTPIIDSSSLKIRSPINSLTSSTASYNTITIESTTKQEFKFTTPSIYTGYNQVINILSGIGEGVAWEEVREALRTHVKHYAPRAYAIARIDSHGSDLGDATSETMLNTIKSEMPKFFYPADEGTGAAPAPITFTINSKTGEAIALVKYRTGLNEGSFLTDGIAENVGDMIKSNYLIITDRNKFSEDGYVKPWETTNPQYSHRIYTDVENGISNVLLLYNYMYL